MEVTGTITRPKTLDIVLTDTQPVEIVESEWPTIASAKEWDNTYEFQANRTWLVKVREHQDGRCIVYGKFETSLMNERDRRGGEIVDAIEDVPSAIHRVVQHVELPEYLADECIGDLPVVTLAA